MEFFQRLKTRKSIDFFARLALSTVFLISLPTKIINFSVVVEAITGRGFSPVIASTLLILAILFIIIGSLFLVLLDKQRLGALFLLAFLIPTTIVFHVFPFQSTATFMNLGLIGGLTLILTREKIT